MYLILIYIVLIFFRFTYCSASMHASRTHIDQQFGDICENRIHLDPVTTRIAHIADAPRLSQKQQFMLLSTISNYHWADLPSIDNVQKIIKCGSSRYVSHLMSW